MDPGSVGALIPVAAILMFGAVKIAKIQAQVEWVSPEQKLRLAGKIHAGHALGLRRILRTDFAG